MDPTTLNSTNIQLQKVSDSSSTPLTFQGVSNGNQMVTFTQTSGKLSDLTNYKIVINPSALIDYNGNSMGASSTQIAASFTTGDSVAPTLVTVNPTDGATNQSKTPTINITFSEPMNTASLTTTNIKLTTESGTLVAGTSIVVSNSNQTATVNLNSLPLSDTTSYKLVLNQTQLTDNSGNPLGNNPDYVATTFTTGDFTAPTLSSTIPLNGATGVTVESAISLTFSESMDTTTLTTSSVKLQKASNNSEVTLNAPSFSNANKTATFQPAINQTIIADTSGNKLGLESALTVSNFATLAVQAGIFYSTGQGLIYDASNSLLAGTQATYAINGSQVGSLGIDGDDAVYVQAGNGIYKYDSSNSTYILIGNNYPTYSGSLNNFAVNSVNKNVYALITSGSTRSVWKSAGGTASWVKIGGGDYPGTVSGTLYLGIDSGNDNVYVNCGCGGDMYKSAASTGNWSSLGTPSNGSYGFIVNSVNHNIYVTGGSTMLLTGGAGTWTSLGAPSIGITYNLALDSSGTLFASGSGSSVTAAFKYSSGSWDEIGGGHVPLSGANNQSFPQNLAVNSNGVYTINAAAYTDPKNIYLSASGTGAWSNVNSSIAAAQGVNNIISSPTSSKLYSNYGSYNLSSYSSGNWQQLGGSGSINSSGQITSLIKSNTKLYAALSALNNYGVYEWNNNTWVARTTSTIPDGAGANQAVVNSSGCIYIGTGYNSDSTAGGDVYTVCPNNLSWSLVGGSALPDASMFVQNIAINGNKVYASSNCGYCYDPDTFDGMPSNVYVSNNGGNWTLVGGSSVPDSTYYAALVAVDTSNGNVYSCVSDATNCYVSSAGTANWSVLSTVPNTVTTNTLVANSTNHNVYVGSSDGRVYVLTSLAGNWIVVGAGVADGSPITAIKIASNGDIYAATQLGHIYKSVAGTSAWEITSFGKSGFPVNSLIVE
jgi:methionine-rich copper-binding protein CopC